MGGHRSQREQGETMTTLENRPNTALLVVDVQRGVVEEITSGAVVANVGSLVDKARRERVLVVWVSTPTGAGEGERRVADRPRADPGRRRAARREELRRLLRGHDPREGAVGPRCRATHRRRRPDRRMHPLDAPRRVRQGLRRDPRERRPHDRGPVGVGGAAARPGHRAHEPVLEVSDGARAYGGNGRDQGCRLRRQLLGPST